MKARSDIARLALLLDVQVFEAIGEGVGDRAGLLGEHGVGDRDAALGAESVKGQADRVEQAGVPGAALAAAQAAQPGGGEEPAVAFAGFPRECPRFRGNV